MIFFTIENWAFELPSGHICINLIIFLPPLETTPTLDDPDEEQPASANAASKTQEIKAVIVFLLNKFHPPMTF